ncbi:NAD(P)/FAD-dependent oxidoreductase [Endozoicomonas sp. SCSIO W0465]|uniref:NAD(P)/FAD-dependent oxidoreductase n=1 Tax=Endozoicomonas sp. SCSIO W0465 TaxID=2918516 RepID=UPI0020756B41|nr:FAD/NAD(P)-binding oxidoreductase [Endozoicomonas sp. SCSIO W0465]USE36184.1 NAD(P)/FAD-dependent oxidoreductase [Endozoicomonas sp. SCSIO W0465]
MKTDVLIIGNSAAGLSAAETIRKHDKTKSVTIVSSEGGNAYSRVLLPYILRGKLKEENVFIRDNNYYQSNDFDYIEGKVTSINNKEKNITIDNNYSVNYESLLIATGSSPIKPPIPGIDQDGVYHMWTKSDMEALIPHFQSGKRVAVIGSGFVSLQAAWAAVSKGLQVTVIELANRIMPSVIDNKGAEILSEKIRSFDVDLRTETMTNAIEKQPDGSFLIQLKGQEPVAADFVIVGTGVRPNTGFLAGSDITVDRGICVDEFMQTNVEGIYAAGDVAAGPTSFGDPHQIHALWPTAIEMGKFAALNMLGKKIPYEGSLNMNVTQMYDLTVASMGNFADESGDEVHLIPESQGMGYMKVCSREHRIVGACLVGKTSAMIIFGMLRPVIRQHKQVTVDYMNLERDLQKLTYGLMH